MTLNTTNLSNLDLSATVGADVRFRDAVTGNEIKYEVEAWDSGADTATIWVSVPQIDGSSATDYIWVYYDYDGTATYDQSTADEQAVWNANFKGVYHLKEDPSTAGSGGIKDSTANTNNGTDQGSMDSSDQVAGRIGGSLNFDSTANYVDFGDVADFDFGTSNFSVSLWVKGAADGMGFVTKCNGDGPTYNGIYIYDSQSQNSFTWWGPSDYVTFDENGSDGQWHYLVVVREGTGTNEFKVYTDGVLANTDTLSTNLTNDRDFLINRYHDMASDNSNAVFDEVRLSNTDRSADWIAASWRSQNGTFAFCNFGSMECTAGGGQFSYRRTMVIDYTKVGADNSGTLPATGFPVLVSLSGNWLKTTAVDDVNGRIENANGWDIVFRGSDGKTGLYHKIEDYDGTSGTLVAWVRIDSLSKSADTTFYMYYGNDCVNVDPSDPDNVWDAGYLGVWHLNEATDATNMDSTSNSYDGSPYNSPTATSSGKIAGALDFDGSDDYISLEGQGIEDHDYDAVTIEAWYKSSGSTVSEDQYIYTHESVSESDRVRFSPTNDSGEVDHVRVAVKDGGTSFYAYGTSDVVDQQWRHLVMVRTGGGAGSRVKIYVDGVEETDVADGSNGGLISLSASDDGPYIGADPAEANELYGFLDEVRVSSTDRDLDWIRTAFNNQSDTAIGAGKFIESLGTEATAFGTAIDLLSLSATGGDSAVQVDWETGSETGNLGFYLYRSTSPAGPYVRITDQLIAGLNHSVEGRAYTYSDADVTAGQPYYYRLEDLDVDGQRTFHGPVGVDWDGAGEPEVSAGDPDPAPWEPGGETGPVTVSAGDDPVYKIMLESEGIHRLTRDYLVAQGIALDKVDLSKVRLYHQAREVAIWVHDDNGDTVFDAADHITFYALPVAAEFAKYSADNVYWLTTGAGENPVKRMATVDSAPDGSATAADFDTTVRTEQDQTYYPSAPGADELDRWFNETWVVGADIAWPGAGDPITFTLDTPGATGNGTLTVALLGTYATDHEVDISVNGGPVRTFTWHGIAFYEAVIEDAALVDGLNTISLTCKTGLDSLLLDWLAA